MNFRIAQGVSMKNKKEIIMFIVMLIVFAVFSGIYINNTWDAAVKDRRTHVVETAKGIGTSLNGEMIKLLNGATRDEGTVAYESIHRRLVKMADLDPEAARLYLFANQNDRLFFMAASEPDNSYRYQPPGKEYKEATPQHKMPFENGEVLITEPARNGWGTWISVLVPLKNADTEEMICVLAMDYPAADFYHEAKLKTLQAIIVVFFAFLVTIAFYIVFIQNMQLKKEEEALRLSKERYRLIFENTPAGVLHFNEKGIITECNQRFVGIVGAPREVLQGFDMNKIKDEQMIHAVRQVLKGKTSTYEGNYQSINGGKITPTRGSFAPILNEKNAVLGGVGIFEDVTDQKRLENQLYLEKNLLKTTLMSIGDGVISTDEDGKIIFMNKEAESLTGWTQEEALDRGLNQVFHILDEETEMVLENQDQKVIASGVGLTLDSKRILIAKDGTRSPIEDTVAPIQDEEGRIVGVVLVFRDITERKLRQEEIEFLSFHDQMTGLYNRRYYEEELKRLDTDRNLPLTIVMGDVNGLKLVNDSFGHSIGDELLKKAAGVIIKGCRTDDIISRIGGDEFVILLPKTGEFETEQIVQRIQEQARQEKAGALEVSISFGYETKYRKEEKIEDILKRAEDRMYNNKLFESPSMRGKTVDVIIKALFDKNEREEQHSERVSVLCEKMGLVLNMPQYKVKELKTLGLVHDIGKIAIDEALLNKEGSLNREEWNEIKRHSEIGYRILSMVNEMSEIAGYVLCHHEKWDGTGYPRGLSGTQIPIEARIIAIADAYDAITSDRSYRMALSKEVALMELKNNAGTQFDSDLVQVFIEQVLVQNEEGEQHEL